MNFTSTDQLCHQVSRVRGLQRPHSLSTRLLFMQILRALDLQQPGACIAKSWTAVRLCPSTVADLVWLCGKLLLKDTVAWPLRLSEFAATDLAKTAWAFARRRRRPLAQDT